MAQLLRHQPLKIAAMIHQPVEIEQPLIDHVLAGGALVFENRRAIVFVQPERVDTSGVSLAGGIFAGEKADAEQRFEVVLDQRLQRLFEIGGIALQFGGLALGEAE